MLKRYYPTLDASSEPPTGAVLTVSVVNTGFETYKFLLSLSRPLATFFVFDRIRAYNFFNCGDRQQGTINALSVDSFAAGSTSLLVTPDTLDGTVNTNKWEVDVIRINGVFLSNGFTIDIGGEIVTVQLQQCS